MTPRRLLMTTAALAALSCAGLALADDADSLLAGICNYPAEIRSALLTVSQRPDVLKQAAEAVNGAGEITLPSDASDNLKQAYETLAGNPDLILFAADEATRLDAIVSLDARNPGLVQKRCDELARGYDRARRAGARAWQQVLESNPGVMAAYIRALDQFSSAQLSKNAHFAYIDVMDRGYYYASPPNAALLGQLTDTDVSPELKDAASQWWRRYGDNNFDSAARREAQAPGTRNSDAVVDWSITERRGMWRPASQTGRAIGRMPVMLQPLDDQPRDAQVAFAVSESMRLWGAGTANPPAYANDPSRPPTPRGTIPLDIANNYVPDSGADLPDTTYAAPDTAYAAPDTTYVPDTTYLSPDYGVPIYGGGVTSIYDYGSYPVIYGYPGYSVYGYIGIGRYHPDRYYDYRRYDWRDHGHGGGDRDGWRDHDGDGRYGGIDRRGGSGHGYDRQPIHLDQPSRYPSQGGRPGSFSPGIQRGPQRAPQGSPTPRVSLPPRVNPAPIHLSNPIRLSPINIRPPAPSVRPNSSTTFARPSATPRSSGRSGGGRRP